MGTGGPRTPANGSCPPQWSASTRSGGTGSASPRSPGPAGSRPPACYKHFPDREHLLAAALLALSAQVGRQARARLRPDPQDSLLGVAQLLVTMAQEHPRLLDLLLFSPAALAALDGTGRYPLLDLVRGEVARMAARHDLDVTTLFTVLWAFIQGYSRLVATGAATYDTDLLRQTMNAFTMIGKNT